MAFAPEFEVLEFAPEYQLHGICTRISALWHLHQILHQNINFSNLHDWHQNHQNGPPLNHHRAYPHLLKFGTIVAYASSVQKQQSKTEQHIVQHTKKSLKRI